MLSMDSSPDAQTVERATIRDAALARSLATQHTGWPGVRASVAAPVNLTGLRPKEFKVLVLPDDVEEFYPGTTIRKAELTKDQEKWATTQGLVIEVAPAAFSFLAETEREAGGGVAAGERVVFAKYAGLRVTSKRDGKEYLLMADKDILATIED